MTDHIIPLIVPSKAVPPGAVLLAPLPAFYAGTLLWQRDPWPPPNRKFTPEAEQERHRALDYLADLLDAAYHRYGMDPEKCWREPKVAEHERWALNVRYRAEERMALQVVNPRSGVAITGVP